MCSGRGRLAERKAFDGFGASLSGSSSDVFWWAFVENVAGFSRRHGDDVRSREELHFLMSEE